MPTKYARGSRAWGICGRSGRRMLLKDMVFDGFIKNLRVDPAWWEPRHPLDYLQKLEDPIALWRPAPEDLPAPNAPVLSAEIIPDTDVLLTESGEAITTETGERITTETT